MKSKITIDVDHDNQPIIKIEYFNSEDVRDKLVGKFLETFSHASVWCRTFEQMVGHPINGIPAPSRISTIRPVHPNELKNLSSESADMAKYWDERQSPDIVPAV